MELWQKIEAILFYKAEPLTIKRLADILSEKEISVEEALLTLEEKIKDSGIILLKNNASIMLGTRKEAGELIEKLVKEELHRDIGRAGLETLSVIMYLGPISRSEIDYIRGVNSSFIIRNLLIRGLIERVESLENKRGNFYTASMELLSHLGLSRIEDLTDYDKLRNELKKKKEAKKESEKDQLESDEVSSEI